MTGRALVKCAAPARSGGRSVRGYGDGAFRDFGAFPVAFALATVGIGWATGQLVAALLLLGVPLVVVGGGIGLIVRRDRAHARGLPAPVEDDSPRPQGPTPAQLAAMTRVTVEVVEPAPRPALPAAPPAVQAVYRTEQAEVA